MDEFRSFKFWTKPKAQQRNLQKLEFGPRYCAPSVPFSRNPLHLEIFNFFFPFAFEKKKNLYQIRGKKISFLTTAVKFLFIFFIFFGFGVWAFAFSRFFFFFILKSSARKEWNVSREHQYIRTFNTSCQASILSLFFSFYNFFYIFSRGGRFKLILNIFKKKCLMIKMTYI